MTITIEQTEAGVRLAVRAQPRASRTELAGEHGGSLKIRVAAPPVEGAANEALTRWLAKRLGVARSAVRIAAGSRGRNKIVEIDGVAGADVRRALGI